MYSIHTVAGSVVAGDVTDNAQSAADVMMLLQAGAAAV